MMGQHDGNSRTPADPVRRIAWPPPDAQDDVPAWATREWLVANGLGGYASGTVPGMMTRRYHGLLIAALPAPFGRTVMLTHLAEQVRWGDGRRAEIGGRENDLGETPRGDVRHLVEFRLESGLPVWRYDIEGIVLERRLFLTHMQNTVHIVYELMTGADRVVLALRPSVNFRSQELPVSEPLAWPYEFRAVDDHHEIALPGTQLPPLRLVLRGPDASFAVKGKRIENVLYPVEESRGYESRGALWSPGFYKVELEPGTPAALVASTEPFDSMTALDSAAALDAERERRRRLIAAAVPDMGGGVGAELVLAADQFVITPAARTEDAARASAAGEEVRTVIAGYHWFTDWGRDTMIALEGLTLVTGRHKEAGDIIRMFARHVRNGLIPNLFPEGEKDGLYHTADATLWFFHAIDRYLTYTRDALTLETLFPTLKRLVAAHRRGTSFGIAVDPEDGLLTQGAPGYQLTWMDAKVDDWVVTPRRGKAVEINALWYNALRLMEQWAGGFADAEAAEYRTLASQVYRSFNERFWYGDGGFLYDVIDTQEGGRGSVDAHCRPNQVLSISLPHPVLDPSRWEPVLTVVRDRLLTPVGLRSLAPDDPDFKSRYFGDLRARDAAYHQGTVWAWLFGPFADAWVKAFPVVSEGRESEDLLNRTLDGFAAHLDQACIGSISEIFDAEAPFTPRGCIAQAWSVAEVLRVLVMLRRSLSPRPPSSV